MIQRWIFLISGFTENRAHPCGIESLWMTVRDYASAVTSVQLHSWNDPLGEMAPFVKRCSIPDPRILIIGYSWGGDAAVDFCSDLKNVGLGVDQLVLGDAVFRSNWAGKRFNKARLRSLLPFAKLRIPANVRKVTWCYQRNNKPAGHEPIVLDPGRTKLHSGVDARCVHGEIDECDIFRGMVLRAVAQAVDMGAAAHQVGGEAR